MNFSFESMVAKSGEVKDNQLDIHQDSYSFSYESLIPTEVAKPTQEMEFNVKCSLVDTEVLKTLGVYVDIEQWTTFIDPTNSRPTKGSMRVRKTTKENGGSTYTSTDKLFISKEDSNGYSHRTEHEVIITKEHFDTRKLMHDSGQIKRRYQLKCTIEGPFNGYTWDIDIFYNKDGTLTNACMIEMEVNEKIDQEMPIPEGFAKMTPIQEEVAKQSVFTILQ
jgi:CYTH domain-containing protein